MRKEKSSLVINRPKNCFLYIYFTVKGHFIDFLIFCFAYTVFIFHLQNFIDEISRFPWEKEKIRFLEQRDSCFLLVLFLKL